MSGTANPPSPIISYHVHTQISSWPTSKQSLQIWQFKSDFLMQLSSTYHQFQRLGIRHVYICITFVTFTASFIRQ